MGNNQPAGGGWPGEACWPNLALSNYILELKFNAPTCYYVLGPNQQFFLPQQSKQPQLYPLGTDSNFGQLARKGQSPKIGWLSWGGLCSSTSLRAHWFYKLPKQSARLKKIFAFQFFYKINRFVVPHEHLRARWFFEVLKKHRSLYSLANISCHHFKRK